jgi:hypothetical protein
LYKFETLVRFEVLLLLLDAPNPASLPMLETLSKIFKRNALKGPSESLAAIESISVGGGAGIGASSRRGSTSKWTKISNLYKYFK